MQDESLELESVVERVSRELARCSPADLVKFARLGYLAKPEAPEFFVTLGLQQNAPNTWRRRVVCYGPRALDQVPVAAITMFVDRNARNAALARQLYQIFRASVPKVRAFLVPPMFQTLPATRSQNTSSVVTASDIRNFRLCDKLKPLEELQHPAFQDVTVVIYSNRPDDFLQSLEINLGFPWRTIYTVNVPAETLEQAFRLATDRTTILTGDSLLERLNLAMQAVDTPFVYWMGDDDFVSPKFLARARDRLRADPGLGSVQGSGRNVILSKIDRELGQLSVSHSAMILATVVQRDPVGRLRETSMWSSIYFHNLLRSDVARAATAAGMRHGVPDTFAEILLDFAITVCGPMVHIPVLSVVRRRSATASSFTFLPFLLYEMERSDAPLRSVYLAALDLIEGLDQSVPASEVATFIAGYVTRNFTTHRSTASRWNRRPSDLLKELLLDDEVQLDPADRYVLEIFSMTLAAGELKMDRSPAPDRRDADTPPLDP